MPYHIYNFLNTFKKRAIYKRMVKNLFQNKRFLFNTQLDSKGLGSQESDSKKSQMKSFENLTQI